MVSFHRFFILILLCFVFSTQLYSQSGFKHLLISSSASYNSSGQSNSLILDSPDQLFISGAGFLSTKESISFSYQPYFSDMAQQTVTAHLNLFDSPILIGLSHLSADNIEIRQKPGDVQGIASAYWTTAAISYTSKLDSFIYSITPKFSFQRLYTTSVSGWMIDFAFTHPAMKLIGWNYVSVQNLGPDIETTGENYSLPTQLKTGFVYVDGQFSETISYKLMNEFSYLFNDKEWGSNLGFDISFMKSMSLIVGYRINHDTNPFSSGFQINYNNFQLVYGLSFYTIGFPNTHAFTCTYQF